MNEHHTTMPIAVVGMACRTPGAENLDEYWDMIRTGRSAISKVPNERLDRELYYSPERGQPGKSYTELGGVIKDRPIDLAACGLKPEMVHTHDPAHLTICDVAASALRHARMDPLNLAQRNCGVYIGHAGGSSWAGDMVCSIGIEETANYLFELEELRGLGRDRIAQVARDVVERVRREKGVAPGQDGPDLSANVAAGLISYAFGLNGPYMVIDAACASSLKALMLGARALQQGRLDMAIVGGASYCKGDSLVLFSQAQSVSATGSRPFDEDADGLISSEGFIALVLKTLPRALADGDPIYSVIRSLGVSSDGRGRSLWAPRKEGQILAMQRAYSGGIDPARLQYIEAHATSTQLGDATEMTALAEALEGRVPPGFKIPLGSIKANIGHTLETAGIAGLSKVVMAMQNKVIPPAINVTKLNPKIDWEIVPFFIPMQEQPWAEPADGLPRRAAVNAFGIGGLNIHIVADEFVPEKATSVYQSTAPAAQTADSAAVTPKVSADEPIAIIGMGSIFPGALTVEAFWDLLASSRDPKSDVTPDRWNAEICYDPNADGPGRSPTKRGGFITDYEYDWRRHKVPPKQIAKANPMQFMLLDAAEAALRQSGYLDKPYDQTKVGVIVGTIFGGDFADQLQTGLRLPELDVVLADSLRARGVSEHEIDQTSKAFRDLILQKMPALLDETGSFTSSTLASKITKTFNLMGGALSLDAGTASSMAAVGAAVDILRAGACEMMICAAGQRNMDMVTYEALTQGEMIARGDVLPSFDANVDGLVPGEGVGVLLLKRLGDARRDGDPVHGIIRSVAAGTDLEQHEQATRTAMARALAASAAKSNEVVAIETTGTGNVESDAEEIEAIVDVYGRSPGEQPLTLTSSIAQLGHAGGASGMASLIKSALALEHQSMPPSLPVREPAEAVQKNASTVHTSEQATPLTAVGQQPSPIVGVTSGSGTGQTFHVVLERGTPVADATQARPEPAAATGAPDWRIVRLGAANMAQLISMLTHSIGRAPALWQTGPAQFNTTDQIRLAVVARSGEDLAKKLKLAVEQIESEKSRSFLEGQGIFCRTKSAQRPRVAFLFPGQSSQYVGMLRELIDECPAAADVMRDADQAMAACGYGSFADVAWNEDSGLGTKNFPTQSSMLLANTILARTLNAQGIQGDVFAGHSYGETPALVAAGAWTLEEAIRVTRSRCDILDAHSSDRGGMFASTAPAEVAEQAVREINDEAYVANCNAPQQTVVSGNHAAVSRVAERLSELGHKGRLLAVPCPFHTPLMSNISNAFRDVMAAAEIRQPSGALISTVTNQYVSSVDDIRANLVNQLTLPVRYLHLIEQMADERETVFVEIGPQQVLTTLNQRILAGRNVAIVATDNRRRPGIEQLVYVRAMLECTGALDEIEESSRVTTDAGESIAADVKGQVQASAAGSAGQRGQMAEFDATARRRQKARTAAESGRSVPASASPSAAPPAQAGGGSSDLPSTPAQPATTPVAAPAATTIPQSTRTPELPSGSDRNIAGSNGNGAAGNGDHPMPGILSGDAPSNSAATNGAVPPSTNGAASNRAPQTDVPSNDQLEKFLVDFVVEETGYPPEIVELDADLEADLGIDSIKKAQLFAALGEHFSILPRADLSMDDYTTLRHVLGFIHDELAGRAGGAPAAAADANGASSNGAPVAPVGNVAPTTAATPPAAPVTTPEPAADVPSNEQLEKFLVDFVVEETGYPPEIVELDADLEADLGIDSIKKAQLFAALGEHFSIMPRADLSMDDYTTLRHVLGFIHDELAGRAGAAPAAPESRVAEINGSTLPAASDVAAPSAAPVETAPPAAAPPADVPSNDQLEKFLVDFVVEETGYPPEIVELDADLEADLGIDSIKKAQLFAALGEHFSILPRADLSMDDYTSLRHVLGFIHDELAGRSASSAQPVETGSESSGVTVTATPPAPPPQSAGAENVSAKSMPAAGAAAPAMDTSPSIPVASPIAEPAASATAFSAAASGPRYNAGLQYGRQNRDAILRALHRSADLAVSISDEKADPVYRVTDPAAQFDADELAEMQGVADGVGVALGNILACKVAAPSVFAAEVSSIQSVASATEVADASTGAAPSTTTAPIPPSVLDGFDPAAPRVMKRLVSRTIEVPLTSSEQGKLRSAGPAIILGTGVRVDALRGKLAQIGCQAHVIDADDPDAAIADLEHIWQTGPPQHMFVMTGCDEIARNPAGVRPWERSAAQTMMVPFVVCQRWIEMIAEAELHEHATLVGTIALGGDFGFEGAMPFTIGGGLAGMLKSIRRECDWLRVKIIDTEPSADPLSLADFILGELVSSTPEAEVAYVGQRRHLVRTVAKEIDANAKVEVPRGGRWIVTGGARGVTALVARELGRRYGLKLHLLGSSPTPQIDPAWRDLSDEQKDELKVSVMRSSRESGEAPLVAWRNVEKALEIDATLRRFAEHGVAATYHQCDACSRDDMARVVDEIRRTDGSIDGVIHGAGVEIACRLFNKKRENVAATIGSKVDGALALMELTKNDPIRYFIGFGSTSGRFGGHGQADYSSASDMLAKAINWYRTVRPDCHACTFHWPSWEEVGMAMRPQIKENLEIAGLTFMPTAEGMQFIVEELEAGLPEAEVLILDRPFLLDLDETMTREPSQTSVAAATEADPTTADARSVAPRVRTAPGTHASLDDLVADLPLVDAVVEPPADGQIVIQTSANPEVDAFLINHTVNKRPLLPAVVSMELFAQAAACLHPDKVIVGLSDVELTTGVPFYSGKIQQLRTSGTSQGAGVECRLVSHMDEASGEESRLFASGRVELGDASPSIEMPDPGYPTLGWSPYEYPEGWDVMYHGPPLRCLTHMASQRDGGRGKLFGPPPLQLAGQRPGNTWLVPSAILDGCMVACGGFAFFMMERRVEIPKSVDSFRFTRLPHVEEECVLRFYYRGEEEGGSCYDFTLFGATGDVIFDVKGYHTSLIAEG